MADEILPLLTRFHRDVLLPDVRRVVAEAVEASERRLRDEMQTHFDALCQRLDRLETEYHMIVAGLKRLEEQWSTERKAIRSEVAALSARVDKLQEQVRALESRLEG